MMADLHLMSNDDVRAFAIKALAKIERERNSYHTIAVGLAKAAEIFFQTGERDPLRTALAKVAKLGIPPKEETKKET